MNKAILLVIALLFFCGFSFAQNKGLDPSFGNAGIASTNVYTNTKFKTSTGLIIQPDGKILLSGNLIARYKPNGTPDSSFAANGFFLPPYTNLSASITFPNARAIALQNDGKILAVGRVDSGACSFIVRIRANGIVDSTFGQNGISANSRIDVGNITVQPDGKVLIIGNGCGNVGVAGDSLIVARYLTDGSVDTSFGVGGFVDTYLGNYGGNISGLGVLADGRITMGGIGHDSGFVKTIVVRYLPDGRPDTSLGGTGRIFPFYAWYCHAFVALPDGRVLLTLSDGSSREDVARLHMDGRPDTSFGDAGFMGIDDLGISSLLPLQDGRILCGGAANGDFAIGCLQANGKGIDSSFGQNGIVTTDITGYWKDAIGYLAVQPDNKIVACGQGLLNQTTAAGVFLARYNANATTGIQSNIHPSGYELAMYPNPAKTQIYLSGLTADKIAAFQVIAADGRLLRTITLPRSMCIPISTLAPGVYLLRTVLKTGNSNYLRFTTTQ